MIKLDNIKGQKFAVLGLGKSGMATAATLAASGADFVVWDDGDKARERAIAAGYKLGNPVEINLRGYRALILAPGIPLTHPAPHQAVIKAQDAGVTVMGDVDLLFEACSQAKFIGITGTNGKSTTTALIAHILQNAGRKVQVGGNLGTAVLSFDMMGSDGIYVLELSSFQLDLMQQNRINIAVFLNITPDHIDRHGDLSGYIAAKSKIISKSAKQTLVIGTDEPETLAIAIAAKQQPHLRVEEITVTHALTQGVMLAGQQIFAFDGENGAPIIAMPMLPRLPGKHNAQNVCAAVAACIASGLTVKEIKDGLRSFPGLTHRQQFVAEIDDIAFINDSKATNADATSKALACYNNIYWIVGGKPKDGGLNGLESFMPRIAHSFVIGAAANDFAAWLNGKTPVTMSGTMDQAVKQAFSLAKAEKKSDATILLSPACASYDQFANFEERGDSFIAYVNQLNPK